MRQYVRLWERGPWSTKRRNCTVGLRCFSLHQRPDRWAAHTLPVLHYWGWVLGSLRHVCMLNHLRCYSCRPLSRDDVFGKPHPFFLSCSLPPLLSFCFPTSPPWNRSQLLRALVCFQKPQCFLNQTNKLASRHFPVLRQRGIVFSRDKIIAWFARLYWWVADDRQWCVRRQHGLKKCNYSAHDVPYPAILITLPSWPFRRERQRSE